MANTSSQEKKPNIFVRMGGWLKRSWSEFKKVSWPTFPEVVKNTGVVLVVVMVFTIIVTLIDLGLSGLLGLLLGA